ncbi:helix-turn-helix transcriptional regulator [Metapseudomonas furukawaii]|uniref:helix-turn-helix transcriptional regulator n=1 Tax=Metapseudomonas furukawaii TaxID=1149133 RepID=UPI00404534B5
MPRADEQKLYDELVSLCYECVLDESRWPELLKRLLHASGRQQGGLLRQYKDSNFANISDVNAFDSAIIGPYNQYYYRLDPGHLFVPMRPVGNWYHDFIDFGLESIKHSPYYQEFHRSVGLGYISSIKLYETATSKAYLSLLTNWDTGLPPAQSGRLLLRLTTHLITAGHLSERIQHLQLDLAKRDLLLDNHPAPLWLLDSEGRVLYCNQAAMQRMCLNSFCLFERYSRLRSKHQDTSLQALIRRAAGKDGKRRSGWMRLNSMPPQELLATPVAADAHFNVSLQQPVVTLILLEQRPQVGLLGDLFLLTPAEVRLAELLARQLSPDDCAKALGVSINTVRTQLRALFRKTGTRRQAELGSLISRLSQ